MNTLLDIGVDLRNIIEASQDAKVVHAQAVQVINDIGTLKRPGDAGQKPTTKPGQDKSDLEGDDWSQESFNVIKGYFQDNRKTFISTA